MIEPDDFPILPTEPAAADPEAVPRRNAGQSMVAAFRAARIRQRPALQSGLRANRETLRQERLIRIGLLPPKPPLAKPPLNPRLSATASEEQAPAPAAGHSVFAQFMDGAYATPDVPTPPQEEPQQSSAPLPAAATPPPAAPPLSAIGFGPGMVIRFHQLGIETAADLAAADPTDLRTGLGDITRLINVDIWIASAQKACAEAA